MGGMHAHGAMEFQRRNSDAEVMVKSRHNF